MPRNQDQWNPRSNRWRGDNDDRDQIDDRDYDYRYTRNDEGDSSVRAGSYDQGRQQYGRRDWNDQSGSTGRRAGAAGRDSGQGHYGQSGYGQGGYDTRGRNFDYDYGYGRQGGYGGDYGRGVYGEGGSRSRFSDHGNATENDYYRDERSGGRYSNGTFGTEHGGWNEFAGEGPRGREGSQVGSPYGYGSRGAGQHRGKGPKGYQRSDDRLKEMISERLRDDPEIDASEITVTVQGGRVTLDGTVDSRRTKNLAEDVAEQFGVADVHNNLRVQRGEMGRPSSPSGVSSRSDDNETSKLKRN